MSYSDFYVIYEKKQFYSIGSKHKLTKFILIYAIIGVIYALKSFTTSGPK